MNDSFRSDVPPQEPQKFDINKLPPAVRAHVPGQTFTFSDDSEYEVQPDGSWLKVREGLKGKARRKREGK